MGEYVRGFRGGQLVGPDMADALTRDLLSSAAFGLAPVFEPEVARAGRSRGLRWLGRRRSAILVSVRPTGAVWGDEMSGALWPEEEAAAAQATAVIAAARARLRAGNEDLVVDCGDAARADSAPAGRNRPRLLPEHLAIISMLVLTMGNAAWRYFG